MILELKRLAEGWRAKATRVENLYGKDSPAQTGPCVAALETCAAEVEELVAEVKKSGKVISDQVISDQSSIVNIQS